MNVSTAQTAATADDEAESLAYGLDWKYDGEDGSDGGKAFLASCSFYDHLFSVWSIS